ncbi:hypothetical protein DIU36_20650 [Mucilaginibacter rubeus]|nr:hypothetical protein DIU36_20650 [Mucilaginibacter rubeus]
MTIVTILTPAALQLYIVRNDVMKTLESDKIPVVFRINLQKMMVIQRLLLTGSWLNITAYITLITKLRASYTISNEIIENINHIN